MAILHVEDDEVMRMALQRAARKAGLRHPLHAARDGVEALASLRGEGRPALPMPRCLLLDLNLPRMDGLELLRELRGDPLLAATPVYVLSTSSSCEDVRAAFAHHVAGYFVKARFGTDFGPLIAWLEAAFELGELPEPGD